jgi:hypothetical protein
VTDPASPLRLWKANIMKVLFWLGIALLVMLPVNFLVVTIGRLLSGEVFGAREVVGLGTAIFGVTAAVILYRRRSLGSSRRQGNR